MSLHQYIHIHCDNCGHEIDVPVYCGNRFCSVCSGARRQRVRERLEFMIDQTGDMPGYRFKFLTLTIANMADLELMVSFLVKSYRKLRNRAFWKSRVHASAFVIEVTGRPGNWHAHIHVMLFAMYINRPAMMKAWKKISGGLGVDIRAKSRDDCINHLCKYISKRQEPEMITDEKERVLKSYRLFQPCGAWFKVQKLWKKKPHPCKKCGISNWSPWDIAQGPFINIFWKDTETKENVTLLQLAEAI